ncbi:MAG: hypothetical protein ABIR70_09165 [Bryobacteraceae bacterium]
MTRRYLPIAVFLSAVLSGYLYWWWLVSSDEIALRRIVRVAVSKSGRWIAAGTPTGWIGIIDQTHPDVPQRFRGGFGDLRDLRFSKDEAWLMIQNNAWAKHPVQSLGSLEPLGAEDEQGDPQPEVLWMSPVERTSNSAAGPNDIAVSGSYDGAIYVYDTRSRKLLRRLTFR